jgi:hypothetical protein
LTLPIGVDFLDLADCAALDELHGTAILLAGVNLDAHLGDQIFLVRVGGELADFVDAVRHRLLLVYGQSDVHGGHRHRRVHVVGGADADGVDILALFGEHLAPVLMDARVGVLGLELIELCGIDFGDASDFELRMAGEDVEGDEGHAAGAEAGEADLIAGRGGNQVADKEGRGQNGPAVNQMRQGMFSRERHIVSESGASTADVQRIWDRSATAGGAPTRPGRGCGVVCGGGGWGPGDG